MINRTAFFIGGWVALVLMAACNANNLEEVNKVGNDRVLPLETGLDVTINYTDSGLTKAYVKAPLLERYATEDKNYTEMRKGIQVDFLDKAGKVESFLKANYAIRYDREKKMTAKNNVVVMNTDGDTLRTELLNWDEASQKIYTDKFVSITTKDEIIMGDGLESDVAFKHPKIFHLRGTISLK